MATLKKFKPYFSSLGILVFIAPIFMILEVLCELIQPYLLQIVIDRGIKNNDKALIVELGGLMIFIAIVGVLLGILNTYNSSKISTVFAMNLREGTFDKIQRLSFRNIDELSISNLIVVLTNDINQLQNFVMSGTRILIRSPLLFIGSIILGIITAPKLSPIYLVIILVISIVLFLIIKKSYPLFYGAQQGLDDMNTTLKENFDGIMAVKSFVQENNEKEKFKGKSSNLAKLNTSTSRIVGTVLPIFLASINLGIVAILWFGGKSAINNALPIGSLVAFINYLSQLLVALIIASLLFMNFTRAMVSAKRVENIMNATSDVVFMNTSKNADDIRGDIIFENVSFDYDETDGFEEYALKDVNLHIKEGEFVGIIGATGSGKSTLVNLIPRFYDPTSGKVLLDGMDIRNYNEATLRKNISIVLQSATLFSGTVKSNIVQGDLDAVEDDITRAAKIAQAKEFIDRLPENYESIVYQRGNNLSGGQKQRISIARGLVGNPKVLILDDSTSALDAKSESLVKRALNRELKNTTTIMVAQKISSIIDADKIVLIDQGQILAVGSHEELMNTSVHYKNIYNTQLGEEA
ncbi:ABC transporter ATP-binding protein [Clostridium paraputrificum]|uniref:ABC transporter ATP-binding protein n=1 Tax=Clostridium TaxID=1485 RepID=UPI0015D4F7C2|nr:MULTISPECIES: ABC transporter ATP-binding protein [Clostridium]MDB2076501.1 ABC transporter ATP-binding protein [Clostridium paraputrificum]MDB2079160.1 ABC transporter ATP-binding protein [Clostridium paraputrificum]MDB2099544.1 ABC transporter ATP-binding protein [Clostridium paraputrificum]MDU1031793.1 ABC transporter ATP-binding protein [Clostridium sp.]MDU5739697.1 ABC transporter ATP-binding protein [Clostridium sp.]